MNDIDTTCAALIAFSREMGTEHGDLATLGEENTFARVSDERYRQYALKP